MGAGTSQLIIRHPRLLSTTKNDKRIRAAVLMTPSIPSLQSTKSAFGSVTSTRLLSTGTRDNLPFLAINRLHPDVPSFPHFRMVMHMNSCYTMQRTLLFLIGRYGMIRLLIQNIIDRLKQSQLRLGMLLCKAMKTPRNGLETGERKKLSSHRTLGKQSEATTDYHHCI